MATFQQFKDSTSSKKVYLVKLRPYKQATGFALDSGSVYKVSLAENAVAVRFDFAWLNQAASRVAMAAGDFFYDTATTTLYVWLAGGADPATGEVYAYFYLYTSTWHGYFDPARNEWHGIVRQVPDFNRGRESVLDRMVTSFGKLRFFNAGFWDNRFTDYIWDDVLVEVRLHGYIISPVDSQPDWLDWSETRLIMSGVVSSSLYTDEQVVFDYFDLSKLIEIPFPLSRYDTTTWPNLDPDFDGNPIHRGYGVLTGITPAQVNTVTRQYKFDDQAVTSIDRVYDDTGTLTPSASSTANATFTLAAAPTGQVFVDYTKLTGSNSYAADIKKEILKNVVGLTDADLDLPSFSQLNTDRPWLLGISIPAPVPIHDIFDEINRSVLAEDVSDRNGLIATRTIEKPSASDPNIEEYDDYLNVFPSPEIEPVWGNVVSELQIGYGRDRSRADGQQYVYKKTTAAGAQYPNARPLVIDTALVLAAEAALAGVAYKPFHDSPLWRVRMVSPIKPFAQFVGDTIKYDRPAWQKGPNGLGAYWRIINIQENKKAGRSTITAEQ